VAPIISYLNLGNDSDNRHVKNISIVIASAVTAYARIFMSQFKMKFLKEGTTLYYSDTDSFDIDRPLDSQFVGGQLKPEHVFDEAVYLAPKVYGCKNKDYEITKIKGDSNFWRIN